MTLEGLKNIGHIESVLCSREEIQELLEKALSKLADSKVTLISNGTRLTLVYNVILICATVALRAMNYRVKEKRGHHYITIETLRFTLKLSADLIDQYQSLREMRNQDFYGTYFTIMTADLDEGIQLSENLMKMTKEWLSRNYPQLM